MPETFNIEEHTKKKPILLLCGNSNPLIPVLLERLRDDFKIAHVCESSQEAASSSENYYRILPDSSYLLSNLEDEIEYGLIFLEDQKDRKYIAHVLSKLKKDNAKILILIDIGLRELFYDILLEWKKEHNLFFGFLGDVFGEGPSFSTSNIAKIIRNATKNKKIIFSGNDLTPVFPISVADAITGIHHILFGSRKNNNFFYLFYSHPQTVISATHLLKRVESDLSIDFQEGNGEKDTSKSFSEIDEEISSKLVVKPQFLDKYFLGFEKSINTKDQNLAYRQAGQTTIPLETSDADIPKNEKIHSSRKTPIFSKKKLLFIFIFSFFVFIIIHIIAMAAVIFEFKNASSAFEKNDFSAAKKSISSARTLLSIIKPGILLLGKLGTIPIIDAEYSKFKNITDASDLLILASDNLNTIQKVGSGLDAKTFSQTIANISFLYFEVEKLRTVINTKIFDNYINEKYSRLISIGEQALQILGYDRDKTYLLLFQNNGELRPNGGFIGSIGEATFSKGKLSKFSIEDVYTGDGQLKAHVEPPYIVRRYLQKHLYLRDSNFSLDFENSASTAALLYNLETGKKVDGVIAIDFEAVRRLIKILGPIDIAGYQKKLDENNTFEFLQDTIDKDFFPGTSKKKELLTSLFNKLSLRLEENPNNIYKTGQLVTELLPTKHILFAFNTTSIQKVFQVNSFSGGFYDPRIKNDNTVYDTFSVNEANIGVNKANISLSRKVEYDVYFSDNKINSKATLLILNSKPSSKDYLFYARFISPPQSGLQDIFLDGKKQTITPAITDFRIYESKNFKPPDGLEVDREGDGLQKFGFVTTTKKQTDQKIDVTYKNGAEMPKNLSLFTYSLLVVKQPGTEDYPFVLRFHYPQGYAPQEVENATLAENMIIIEDTLIQDKEYKIKLIKR